MKLHKELKHWLIGFKDMASYHQGDYQKGMNRVLQGLESQMSWIENLEEKNLKFFVDFVNENIWDKPSNTMNQHLDDFINERSKPNY